jgi:hypothetical protein
MASIEPLGERIIDNWGVMELYRVNGINKQNCPAELLKLFKELDVSQFVFDNASYS